MDLQEIINRYRQDDVHLQPGIVEQIRKDPRVHLHLKGILITFLLTTAVYLEKGGHHLLIMNDQEEAGYILDDLRTLLPGKDILFLP